MTTDIPPYMLVDFETSSVSSINQVGMTRSDFSESVKHEIKEAFRYLYRRGLNTTQALEEIEKHSNSSEIKQLVEFVRGSKRGIGHTRRFPLTKEAGQDILLSIDQAF